MSGNNNLQKGLCLTKPKGVQLFPTIVPKVFSKSDVCRATCFYLRNSFKATVVSTEISVKCFFALHVAGLFVEVLQGEVVYFWGNFAL